MEVGKSELSYYEDEELLNLVSSFSFPGSTLHIAFLKGMDFWNIF